MKLKQKEIAEAIGKNQATVSKYFSGKLKISLEDALILEKKFGIDPKSWIKK